MSVLRHQGRYLGILIMENINFINEIDALIASMEKIPVAHNAPGVAAVYTLINWPAELSIVELPGLLKFICLFKDTHNEDHKDFICQIKNLAPLVNGCLKFKYSKLGCGYNKVSNIELFAALKYISILDKRFSGSAKENVVQLLLHVSRGNNRYSSVYATVSIFYNNAKQAWITLHSAYKSFCASSLFKGAFGFGRKGERFKICKEVVDIFEDCLRKYSADFYAEVFFQPEKYIAHRDHILNLQDNISQMAEAPCVSESKNSVTRMAFLKEICKYLDGFLALHKLAFAAQVAFQKAKVVDLEKSTSRQLALEQERLAELSRMLSDMEGVVPVNSTAAFFASANASSEVGGASAPVAHV
jgi:hypothetical protein